MVTLLDDVKDTVRREWQTHSFAGAWPDPEFVQRAAAHMPRSYTRVILDILYGQAERERSIRGTI
ncbi:hypothetical protein [Methanofollis tationis]|uniref:Uncharacterized protein n=1 Tax=Methanofollis tationis TaxID=81417 RepID=A0A7K4HKP1_9EURY|nr:hypothetical protein [Methanofollis tationis]NVO65831.1 hypothetical protein [Methanofollis tationis]